MTMNRNLSKLAPWNWFKKEQRTQNNNMPLQRGDMGNGNRFPLDRMRREMERLFDDFYQEFGIAPHWKTLWPESLGDAFMRPEVDISATEKQYKIEVELPGVQADDVKIEISGDNLIIKGEKKQEKEEKEEDYYALERSYGSFQRILDLPEDAQKDDIKADFKNGVMSILIPRTKTAKSEIRQIEVHSS
ncbi:MAG: Hsp20/alpha crystallin family protein [Candidatus Sumerlaeia bacterium]